MLSLPPPVPKPRHHCCFFCLFFPACSSPVYNCQVQDRLRPARPCGRSVQTVHCAGSTLQAVQHAPLLECCGISATLLAELLNYAVRAVQAVHKGPGAANNAPYCTMQLSTRSG